MAALSPAETLREGAPAATAGSAAAFPARVHQKVHWSERVAHGALAALALALVAFLALPLATIVGQSLQGKDGAFVGLANFANYLQTPSLWRSCVDSVWVSALATAITLPIAFVYAYALTRSRMPGKAIFRTIALIPLLAPSLLSALSLIYWFGNQGVARGLVVALGGESIYGAPGVVVAECFAVFPHAVMILLASLSLADARLYEAADALGTSARRRFTTITLPGARYGLVSAALVCFTLVVTDFGIPKVIGGNFQMLATDVFKLVIGQQDFQRGAVVALFLLAPAVVAFAIESRLQRRQRATLGARAVPLRPKRSPAFDAAMFAFASIVAALMLAMLGMAIFASFATYWPYNLAPTWRHYTMGWVDAEVGSSFRNSLVMATGTALVGTVVVFCGAYLVEKTRGASALRALVRMLATMPMAVPGLVLGLGYIFFFNAPANPLSVLYRTMPLLVACTIVHYYTTGHLTALAALKSLDPEFEAVSASLKVPFFKTFWRVTLPICTPTLIEIARFFFVNAMTTISAVVFLYSPDTKVAAIAILNLDEAGEAGPAAACAVLITAASTVVTLASVGLGALVERRTQAWRRTPAA